MGKITPENGSWKTHTEVLEALATIGTLVQGSARVGRQAKFNVIQAEGLAQQMDAAHESLYALDANDPLLNKADAIEAGMDAFKRRYDC